MEIGQQVNKAEPADETHEWGNDAADEERNHIGPRRQCDIAFQHYDQAEEKADNEHNHVPPPRRFLVMLDHVIVVTVIEHAFACTGVSRDDVLTPENDHMCYKCADLDNASEYCE